MSRAYPIVLSMLVACVMPIDVAMASGQRPTGSDIPELTSLNQVVNDTTLGSSNFVSALDSVACSGFTAVPGPDLVYTWLAQTGDPDFPLHLDFLVTPEAAFDTVVYALSELDDGASCVAATDNIGPGAQEMLHVEEQLTPGHRYYLYIDSRNASAPSGSFQLRVSTFIPVELQSFSIE